MTKEEMKELKGLAASMGLYDDKNPCKRAVILGKAIKALEQEPKMGRWISLDDFRGKYNEYGFMCTECNEHSDYEENFCPNCGAKMQEMKDES